MNEIIMETVMQIMGTLLIALIGVLGTWLTAKIGKRQELSNIADATNEAVKAAQLTVLELQQTVVDGWKAANEDGKLTNEEVEMLGVMLIDKTVEKMSDSAINLLVSAGVDITAIIKGAGEAMIKQIKD